MFRNVDHALLVIGTHSLKVNKKNKSSHSFVPLLFYLCDSESGESYEAAFEALNSITGKYYDRGLEPDVIRGDHHWGFANAARARWPSATFVVCRTHAYNSVREASIPLSTGQREVWLSAWHLLLASCTREEFNSLVHSVAFLFREGFEDKKAADVLEKQWTGALFGTWYAGATGIPCAPPDNNALESFQRDVGRLLGERPEPLPVLLPRRFRHLLQKEVHERRDKTSSSLLRVPWFFDAHAKAAAEDIIRLWEAGVKAIIQVQEFEYAVRAGHLSQSQGDITPGEIEERKRVLDGEGAEIGAREWHFRGLPLQARIDKVDELVKSYCTRARAIHLVTHTREVMFGAPKGIDGWRCDCKGWWDAGQCKHVLAVAHVRGEVDLLSAELSASGRPQERRPARVKQPADPRKRPRENNNEGHEWCNRVAKRTALSTHQLLEGTPVVARDSRAKNRQQRPREAERGRAKQRKSKAPTLYITKAALGALHKVTTLISPTGQESTKPQTLCDPEWIHPSVCPEDGRLFSNGNWHGESHWTFSHHKGSLTYTVPHTCLRNWLLVPPVHPSRGERCHSDLEGAGMEQMRDTGNKLAGFLTLQEPISTPSLLVAGLTVGAIVVAALLSKRSKEPPIEPGPVPLIGGLIKFLKVRSFGSCSALLGRRVWKREPVCARRVLCR